MAEDSAEIASPPEPAGASMPAASTLAVEEAAMADKPSMEAVLRKRVTKLEAVAHEIVRLHRDVDSGSDFPRHLYIEACDALGIDPYPSAAAGSTVPSSASPSSVI